jgi:hypothetical protein
MYFCVKISQSKQLKMKTVKLLSLAFVGILFGSCSDDDDNQGNNNNDVVAPATYSFTRDGASTVSYSGQSTRIAMAEEFISATKDETATVEQLQNMFDHKENAQDYSDASLNASNKSVRSKTAASYDYFNTNATDASAIKAQYDAWISAQASEVFPNWTMDAAAGQAGKIQEAGGGSTRYVNAKGLEYNQAIAKSLIGGLMTDQMLNNYLGTGVLDAGENTVDNDNETLSGDKNYTTMEHKWDEAFGYLYGAEADATNPELGVDSFLSKYLARVEGDSDFTGIAANIYNAFKMGRAAIVAKNYEVRDQQAEIIREEVSKIIGIRAVYYLQQGKGNLESDKASAFHDLSEGFGFVYSLQFTRKPGTTSPYLSKAQVDDFISQLEAGNGFWDLTAETLDAMSDAIAAEFDFTVEQAGS